MYATPVVEGKTVVATVIPPGSITQRARLGSSPRSSRSRSTSCRAPSISTSTTRRPSVRVDPTVPPGAGPGGTFASAYQAIFKSASSPLAIPPDLTRRDHLLQQDGPLDRRGEHVSARVRDQPALPLERIERRLQRRRLKPGGTEQAVRVHTLRERCRRPEHPTPMMVGGRSPGRESTSVRVGDGQAGASGAGLNPAATASSIATTRRGSPPVSRSTRRASRS